MELTVVAVFVALMCIVLWIAATRRKHVCRKPRILARGQLLVVDTGSIVINEPLPKMPGMFDNIEKYVVVEFDSSEPVSPPCSGGCVDVDQLNWELTYKHRHDARATPPGVDTLRLKIMWQVSTARTIVWKLFEPAKKER